jgi:hypothetical protein
MIDVKSFTQNKRRFICCKRGKIGTKRITNNESENPIKVKRNNYINEDNDNDPFGILALRKFIDERFIFNSAKIADYPKADRPLKRKLITHFLMTVSWIITLKYGLLAFIDKPWIWTLFEDSFYAIGKQELLSAATFFFGFMFLGVQYKALVYEKNEKMEIISYLNQIQNNSNDLKLKQRYYSKFCKESKFLVKSLRIIYRINGTIPVFLYGFLSVKAFLDPDLNFSSIKLLVNFMLYTIWIQNCAAVSLTSYIICIITPLHLKYRFKQIMDEIQECFKSGNSYQLMKAIREHNNCSVEISKLNEIMSGLLAIIYFPLSIAFNIVIHITINSDNAYVSFSYAILSLIAIGTQYVFIYFCSSVSSSAHNLRPELYSFLIRNKSTVKEKLKISAFIEKLSGPIIGFYCYKFFPFTSYKFAEFIAFVSGNYILLNNLIF